MADINDVIENLSEEQEQRTSNSLELDIVRTCTVDDVVDEKVIMMEMDSEYNHGNTCFQIGTPAYFRVYTNMATSVHSTRGGPSGAGSDSETVDESIEMSGNGGSSSKPISSMISHEWLGKSLGSIRWVTGGTAITVGEHTGAHISYPTILPSLDEIDETPENLDDEDYGEEEEEEKKCDFGILHLVYRSNYRRYSISSNEEGKVVVWAESTEDCTKSASLTIEFGTCGEESEVTILVKDFITNAPIPSAAVSIGGVSRGLTGLDGSLYVGKMRPGTYEIVVSAYGYQSSVFDGLSNDLIVVPEGSES